MGELKKVLVSGLITMTMLLFGLLFSQPALAADSVIVTGTVTDAAGTPLADIPVECHTANGSFMINGLTNASGQYSLSGDPSALVSGTTQLTVEVRDADGYNSSGGQSFTYTSGVTPTVNFALIAANYTVNVTVLDDAGNPVVADVLVQPIHLEPGESAAQASGSTNEATGQAAVAVSFDDAIVIAEANLSEQNADRYPWVAIGPAQEVHFSDSVTTADLNFSVARSDSKVMVKMVDANGAILTGNDFTGDVYFEGYNEEYGAVHTRRKVNSSNGVATAYLLPGVWHVSAIHRQLSGQSFDPVATTFVINDEPGTTDLGTIQASVNAGVLSGTAALTTTSPAAEKIDFNTIVSALNLDTNDRFFGSVQTDGTFTIQPVSLGTYALTIESGNYIPSQTGTAEVTAAKPTVSGIALSAKPADVTIQGALKDETNTAVANFDGMVVVETENGTFSAPITPDGNFTLRLPSAGIEGDSVSVQVVTQPGADGYAEAEAVTIAAGTLVADLTVKTDEATITGSIKNESGTTVDSSKLGEAAVVLAINTTNGSVESATVSADGSYSLDVGPGKWNLVPQLADLDATVYASSMSGDAVTVEAGEDKTKNINVLAENATITGTITDTSGNAVPEAPVVITNLPALQAAKSDVDPAEIVSITTTADSAGEVTAAVPAGTYSLVFGTTPDMGTAIAPATESITVKANKTADFSAEFQKTSNTSLSGNVQGKLESASITAYSPAGGSVTSDVNTNGSYDLDLAAGDWDIVASGVKDGLLYVEQAEVTVKTGENSKDYSPVATDIAFPAAVTVSGSVDENISLSNSDGAKVDLPAFATGYSGEVTATLAPVVAIVNTGEISQLGLAYEVRVVDEDGIPVTNLNKDATVTLPLDEKLLGGISEEEITASYYNEALATNLFDGMAADVKDDTMVIQTKHFSRFSATTTGAVNYAPAKIKTTTLNVAKITDSSAKVSWKKPAGSVVTAYQLQVRKKGAKKTKTWKNFEVATVNKIVRKLSAETFYQFRVRACNAGGCGIYTDWTAFKTK